MPSRSLVFALCALIALPAIPLAFEWVTPNPWYGFRTPATLACAADWYETNMVAGALFVVSMLAVAGTACVLSERLVSERPWMPGALLVLGVGVSVAGSIFYLRFNA